MRDDREVSTPSDRLSAPAGAVIIPFPVRSAPRAPSARIPDAYGVAAMAVLDTVARRLSATSALHAPTHLAALGALAGFSAQQSLLMTGGAIWAQPARAGHLDRLLLSAAAGDASLWFTLRATAHFMGARNLPDPQTLADATLRCVGTMQLGRITLPLEYRLLEQPQATLMQLWPRLRDTMADAAIAPADWPPMFAQAAARRVSIEQRQMPVPVALRVVMQSALAMALIEPRVIPGAATRPGAALAG